MTHDVEYNIDRSDFYSIVNDLLCDSYRDVTAVDVVC